MANTNITTFSSCILKNFNNKTLEIYKNNVNEDTTSAKFQTEVVYRGRSFASFVASPFVGALDFVYSIILTIGTVFSRDVDKERVGKFLKYSSNGASGLSIAPYTAFLKFINPHAELSNGIKKESGIVLNYVGNLPDKWFGNGLAEKLLKGNFFQKHILTRLIGAGQLLSLTIAKIVDFVIGIFSAVVSIVLLGKSKTWNDRAARQLNLREWALASYLLFTLTVHPEKIKVLK